LYLQFGFFFALANGQNGQRWLLPDGQIYNTSLSYREMGMLSPEVLETMKKMKREKSKIY
jgi:hypothetical protein